MAYAASGNWEAYSKGVCTMLKLSHHLMLTATGAPSETISIAYQFLNLRPIQDVAEVARFDDTQLRSLQEQVAVLTLRDALYAMRFERVANTSTLLRLKGTELRQWLDWVEEAQIDVPQWLDGLRATLIAARPRGWKVAEAAVYQDKSVALFQNLSSPDGLSVDWTALAAAEAELMNVKAHPRWLSLEGVMVPLWGVQLTLFKKLVERQALANSIVAWCAVERYRIKHGRAPSKLADLQPEFLKSIPVDPVDGAPLRYILQSDGTYLIYSIGWNRVDDAGHPGEKREKKDWVWASNPAQVNAALDDKTPSGPGDISK
jgi:hypothetical protein